MPPEKTTERIPIRDLVRYYLRLGLLGFGGPVALVGQMERELVGEKKWLTQEERRGAMAVCQSLPGPLAIQVGIWISYIRGGFWGAWAGGWAFILPNFVIVARDDDEVRQDEGPAAGPRAPEAAAYIGDPDPDLDGERPGQRLADRHGPPPLLLRQPLLLTHQFAFHLPDQRDRPTEAEQAEPQVVPNEITDRDTLGRLFGRHHRVSSPEALQECNA